MIQFVIENDWDFPGHLFAYRNGEPVYSFCIDLDEEGVREFMRGFSKARYTVFVEYDASDQ